MSANSRPSLLYLSMYDPHLPMSGAGTRGFQFVTELSKTFDLDLVYMQGCGHPPDPDLIARVCTRYRLDCVRSKRTVSFRRHGYFYYDHALIRHARELMQAHHHDWLLCDYGLSARYGLALIKEFGVRTVYSSHNIEYRLHLNKARAGQLPRWPMIPYVHHFEKKMCGRCDELVAISEDDAEFYSTWTDPEKITVIPQGFDDQLFHSNYPPPKNSPKIVLFCGNMAVPANREGALRVISNVVGPVLERFPDTKFRFVGAGAPVEASHPNVEFTGFLHDYPAALQQADVVISPVMVGQGFPTKIVEALACGKPIVSTPKGARAIPRDFANLKVVPIEGFAEAICGCLERDQPVDSTDAQRLCSMYSWKPNIGRLTQRMLAAL